MAVAQTLEQVQNAVRSTPMRQFTLATLPSVLPAYRSIVVTDAAGGPAPCWSNGTNWLTYHGRSIVA